MKPTVIISAILMSLFGFHEPASPDISQIVVRVTAFDSGEEVPFEASYLFRESASELKHLTARTPFTAQANSDLFVGIFHSQAQGKIKVEMTKLGATDESPLASADGCFVIITEQYGRRTAAGF